MIAPIIWSCAGVTCGALIRLAVALLLSRAGELDGATEDELRRSLGLRG